jgi:hypothetical protein
MGRRMGNFPTQQVKLAVAGVAVLALLAGCPNPDSGGRRPVRPAESTIQPQVSVKPTVVPVSVKPTVEPVPVKPTVVPGAYCQTLGQVGVTKTGHPMRCVRKVGEDRPRWRDANAVK